MKVDIQFVCFSIPLTLIFCEFFSFNFCSYARFYSQSKRSSSLHKSLNSNKMAMSIIWRGLYPVTLLPFSHSPWQRHKLRASITKTHAQTGRQCSIRSVLQPSKLCENKRYDRFAFNLLKFIE